MDNSDILRLSQVYDHPLLHHPTSRRLVCLPELPAKSVVVSVMPRQGNAPKFPVPHFLPLGSDTFASMKKWWMSHFEVFSSSNLLSNSKSGVYVLNLLWTAVSFGFRTYLFILTTPARKRMIVARHHQDGQIFRFGNPKLNRLICHYDWEWGTTPHIVMVV